MNFIGDDRKIKGETTSQEQIYIVGGGLAGGLLALALKHKGFENFILFERSGEFGGHHTWSFRGSDLPDACLSWIHPLITASWQGYDIKFPKFSRTFQSTYHSVRSENLHQLLSQTLSPKQYSLNSSVSLLNSEMLQVGTQRYMGTVIDARSSKHLPVRCAYQKFVGYDVQLIHPHGLDRPLTMDATVDQKDGFRFINLLPFDQRTVMIEDTRYSSTPTIDKADFDHEIHQYAQTLGGGVQSILRSETGTMALPLQVWPDSSHLKIGTASGLFHFTTGFSFVVAAKVAQKIATAVTENRVFEAYQKVQNHIAVQNKFFVNLNRMLFGAVQPHERRQIFEQFYARPQDLVERFYAMELKPADRMRFLLGRSPVSIPQAIKSVFTDAWMSL